MRIDWLIQDAIGSAVNKLGSLTSKTVKPKPKVEVSPMGINTINPTGERVILAGGRLSLNSERSLANPNAQVSVATTKIESIDRIRRVIEALRGDSEKE